MQTTYRIAVASARFQRWRCRITKRWGDILKWACRKMCRANSRTPPASFRSSAKAKIRRACSPAKADRNAPTSAFTTSSQGLPAKRLSTAFDSVTLYGHDPGHRPDIYGKIGNSGVSICCLDDAKKLYSGFNLADPKTSVSMTINGPAPMITGFFMNAAIDQQCELYIKAKGLGRGSRAKDRGTSSRRQGSSAHAIPWRTAGGQ